MNPSIIDTHAHLDMSSFDNDRYDVISRALNAGITVLIDVAIDLKSSIQTTVLASKHEEIFATAGIHPQEAEGINETDIAELARIARHPQIVALGEIGLDFYRNISTKETQLQVFKWQLGLADELNLPVIIHCRQAEEELLPVLQNWTASRRYFGKQPVGVIHCFSGDRAIAEQFLGMGFFLSFGAYVSYPSSLPLHDVIRRIPPDKFMLETDSPFLPPQSHRGQRNEPAYLKNTAEVIARIRQESFETIASRTSANARLLFRLPENDGE